MSQRVLNQLEESLRQEEKLYQALLDLAAQKTDLIVQNRVRELEQATEKEQQFIREMSRFEQIRQSLLQHFAEEKELEKAPQNLSELLLFLREEDQTEILRLRASLGNVLEQLQEKNQQNEGLIQQSLDFIQMNIELFTRQENSTPYDRKADEGKKQDRNLFDAKY